MLDRSLATLALAATLLAAAGPPSATAADVDLEERSYSAEGVDTIVIELTTTEGFQLLDKSYLDVVTAFPQTNDTQRAAVVTGIVQNAHSEDCPGDDDEDPCFMDMKAGSIEDVGVSTRPGGNGDLRADTGPGLDVSLDTGHDHESIETAGARIDLAQMEFPHDDSGLAWWTSYHLFVSVPGAQHLDAELRYVAKGNVSVTGQNLTDTGFTHWIDDMRAAGTHSVAANAYVGPDVVCGPGCGEASVDPAEGEHVFGAIGPGQNGFYTAHVDPTGNYCAGCLGPIPATFVGQWGADTPHWTKTVTGVGIVSGTSPSAAIATVPGIADHAGDHDDDGPVTFFVDNYATLGPQDLVAAGFVTPTDPAS